jgi:GNAT superfamily N-acetyltransferase
MEWKREFIWDESKKNIIGSNPNAFNLGNVENDAKLQDDWWALINDEGEVLGYGWIKYENNEAELSVSVHSKFQNKGFGSRILINLEQEAIKQGSNKLIAVIQESNSIGKDVITWLYNNKYQAIWPGVEGYLTHKLAEKYVAKATITLEKNV